MDEGHTDAEADESHGGESDRELQEADAGLGGDIGVLRVANGRGHTTYVGSQRLSYKKRDRVRPHQPTCLDDDRG